jgi:hypothetical protein
VCGVSVSEVCCFFAESKPRHQQGKFKKDKKTRVPVQYVADAESNAGSSADEGAVPAFIFNHKFKCR